MTERAMEHAARKMLVKLMIRVTSGDAGFVADPVANFRENRVAAWKGRPLKTPLLAVRNTLDAIAATARSKAKDQILRCLLDSFHQRSIQLLLQII